jgi:hypothetical protein
MGNGRLMDSEGGREERCSLEKLKIIVGLKMEEEIDGLEMNKLKS